MPILCPNGDVESAHRRYVKIKGNACTLKRKEIQGQNQGYSRLQSSGR